MAERIARCLKETKGLKLQIEFESGAMKAIRLASWSNIDFAADKRERKSVSGCVITMDGAAISWNARSTVVSL